ncbi:hypothetical protein [Streptomyces anulatus]|uniref:hypothetical protein n=1 Tax=Streptomyces anulatus TaxID=1892 RepID=UPI001C27600B|nr:hypothetical protein [Streptomyces anulatus]
MDREKLNDRNFLVEVRLDGPEDVPPLRIPVQCQTPDDALSRVKTAVLDWETRGPVPGGSVFTVAVFPESYEAGAEALAAERITLVTMPFADEIRNDMA